MPLAKLAYAQISLCPRLSQLSASLYALLFATRTPYSSDFEENNWLLTVYDFLKREQISDIPSFQDDHSQN